MSLINNYQRDNDPRKVIEEISDPKPISPQVQPTTEEQLNIGTEEPIIDVPQEEVPQEELNSLQKPDQQPTVPVMDNPSVVTDNSFMPNPQAEGIFPTISELNSDTQNEANNVIHQQQVNAAGQAFDNGRLTGNIYPALYEINNTRESLINMQRETDVLTLQSIQESRRALLQSLRQPVQKQVQTPEGHDPSKPNLNSRNPAAKGILGVFSNAYNSRESGDNLEPSPWSVTHDDGKEFDPLRGIYNLGKNFGRDANGKRTLGGVARDVFKAAGNAVANPFSVGGVFSGGKFGDYPDGTLGFMLYALDMTTNVPLSAATDLINKTQGKKQEQSNLTRALLGEDYSFTTKKDEDKPLSVMGGTTKDLKTWDDLYNRSWLWKYSPLGLGAKAVQTGQQLLTGQSENLPQAPANAIESLVAPVLGKEKAEKVPGILLQSQEFTSGLALDALTGNWFEGVLGTGNRVVRKVITKPAKKATNQAVAKHLGNQLEGVDLKALPPGRDLDIPDPWANDVPPQPNLPGTDLSSAMDEVEFKPVQVEIMIDDEIAKSVPSEPLELRTIDVDATDDIGKVNGFPSQRAIGEEKFDEVAVEVLTEDGLTKTKSAPFELRTVDVDSKEAVTFAFPSTAISDDGLSRVVSPQIEAIGTNPSLTSFINPKLLDVTRNSNKELTLKAIQNGYVPERTLPLSSRRIEIINQQTNGQLSRYSPRALAPATDVNLPNRPPVINEVTKISKAVDNITDDVVDAPSTNTAIIEYQTSKLPRELVSRSTKGIDTTKLLAKNEQVMLDLSEEVSELKLKYEVEVEAVERANDLLNDVPDVGRRNIFEATSLGDKYLPPNTYDSAITPYVPDKSLVDEINGVVQKPEPIGTGNFADVFENSSGNVVKTYKDLTDANTYMTGWKYQQALANEGLMPRIIGYGRDSKGRLVNVQENLSDYFTLREYENFKKTGDARFNKKGLIPEGGFDEATEDLIKKSFSESKRTLNNLGLVMGDHTKSNVMFNPKTLEWKLIDSDGIRKAAKAEDIIEIDDVVIPELTDAALLNPATPTGNNSFYHGTKAVNLDIENIDPVLGAARSEIGVGIHFTNNIDMAKAYADAKTTRNIVPVETRTIGNKGEIIEVKPTVKAPILSTTKFSDSPMVRDTTSKFLSTYGREVGLSSTAIQSLKNYVKTKKGDLIGFFEKMSEVGKKYYVDDGLDFPETEILQLQQLYTQNLRSALGIDSVVHKGKHGTQLTLLGTADGNSIKVAKRTPSDSATNAVYQAASRNNADVYASEMFPNSSYAKANAADSKVDLLTQTAQRTATQLDALDDINAVVADKVARYESELRELSRAEKGQRMADKIATWKKQNKTRIKHWNKPEEGIC